MRSDLPRGVQAAQLVHAAGESSPGNLPQGTCAVVLTVPNETKLIELEFKLRLAGILLRMIREPDAPWNGQAMAIGICPIIKDKVKKYLSNLPLLK